MNQLRPVKYWEASAYEMAVGKAFKDGFRVVRNGFELGCTETGAAFTYDDTKADEIVLAVVMCTSDAPDAEQMFGKDAREYYDELCDEYTLAHWPGKPVRVDLYVVELDDRYERICHRYENASSPKWARISGV